MNATPSASLIPEVRTGRGTAIALSVGALFALAVSVGLNRHLEDALGSSTAATALLAAWCVLGVATAIAAVIDAYVRPDGELLGLIVAIAATVFAIASLLVVAGVVTGATSETVAEAEQEINARDGNS
jgi:uncharacterized membrane protein